MPVRNNGPGGYSRVSTTRKSKIEPEYPQWAESKMRAIENRRLKELQAVVRDSMPEILAIAADEMDTASESIRKDGYSDMVRRIQNRFRIMRDRLSRRLKTDPLERDVRRCADYTDRRQLQEWQRSVRATLGIDISKDFFIGERYEQIIKVDIAISEAMAIDGGYDTILIIGPLPKTPGGHMTPDVAGYTGTQDLKSAGFSTDDPVYIAASKVFAQSPKATMVMVAVQKTTSGSAEKVDVTLDRAKAVPGWYCICPAGIKEDFYQSIADWTESNEKFCVCETTGISASPVSDAMFRTAVIHATKENDCVNAAYAAKFLSYEPGSELWAYKSLSMVEAQSLSTTDIASLESRNVSYYTTIGSQAMVQGGKVSAGEWIDTIRFRDWLKTQIQQNVINLMLSLPKVPYTDPGIGLVQNAVTAALDAGVEAGGIARPSSDEATGTITPSYTITVPKAAELDAATRKTRVLPKVKWSAQLAGALIATEIGGTLNY